MIEIGVEIERRWRLVSGTRGGAEAMRSEAVSSFNEDRTVGGAVVPNSHHRITSTSLDLSHTHHVISIYHDRHRPRHRIVPRSELIHTTPYTTPLCLQSCQKTFPLNKLGVTVLNCKG